MPARIIAVCNQKGGVGKTTLVTGLAEVFSRDLGLRVLVIDADPQANATKAMGIYNPEFTLNDVLSGDQDQNFKIIPGVAADAVIPAGEAWQGDFPELSLIASERNLASRELDSMMARERRLHTSLRGVVDDYDVVLIDCPPSLGLLTVNVLTAATHVLLVSEARVSSVEGLTQIVTTVAEVQENLNEDLDIIGIAINKVRKGRVDQEFWVSKMREDYGDLVLEPALADREILAKSQAAAKPIMSYGRSATMPLKSLNRLAKAVWEGAAS
ncbi:Sporulation initiation inhibitor protein Soj [compost metagenome]